LIAALIALASDQVGSGPKQPSSTPSLAAEITEAETVNATVTPKQEEAAMRK
jgi:hypothetical protein